MTTVRPIIGFEIHVQLATRTKLFCGCPIEFGAPPNSLTCPVCLGLPGALPVLNRRAYELAVRGGIALGCRIAKLTKWDRKSYYYPDMPKNYQISQYDQPLSSEGRFEFNLPDGSMREVGIIRAHLEEDAGKSLHEGSDQTRVDLNRAGTPLLEIVTRPEINGPDEAYAFCVELQRTVRFLGVSEAEMQRGQMRFEPNVNLAMTDEGREFRTPICEIKNLNSFRSVRGAIRHEIDRQTRAWESDHDYTLERLGKMNLGWNDVREVTEFQREKEESHDYRYFPDPDLAPVAPEKEWIEKLREEIGELPAARERRFASEYGLSTKECELILADRETGELFEEAIRAGAAFKTVARHILGIWNHLASAAGTTSGRLGVTAGQVSDLARLVDAGEVGATAAAQIAEVFTKDEGGRSARQIAEALGVLQVRDESATAAWVDEAFAAHAQAVRDALANPKKAKAAVGFLRGAVMKLSQGRADPKLAGELIERKLSQAGGES